MVCVEIEIEPIKLEMAITTDLLDTIYNLTGSDSNDIVIEFVTDENDMVIQIILHIGCDGCVDKIIRVIKDRC